MFHCFFSLGVARFISSSSWSLIFSFHVAPPPRLFFSHSQINRFNANLIRKVDVRTGVVTTVAGVAGVRATTDGVGTSSFLSSPASMVYSEAGGTSILYFLENYSGLIRMLNLVTGNMSTVPFSSTRIGVSASFSLPSSLTIDTRTQSIYVADTGNNRLMAMRFDQSPLTQWCVFHTS